MVSRILSIACSLENRSVFESIVEDFNTIGYRDLDGENLALRCNFYEDAYVLGGVVTHDFRLFVPASALSAFRLREMWAQRYQQREPPPVEFSSFAASPVVFVMSSRIYNLLRGEAATEWGGGNHAPMTGQVAPGLGWQSLVGQEQQLRLIHAHGTTPDGLAVMAAEWMWSCRGREPSAADAAGAARDLVHALEERVVEYAPDDRTALRRARSAQADVVLAQESAALAVLAEESGDESVIVYPAEGTVWVDHVLGKVQYGETERPVEHADQILSTHLRLPHTADRLLTHGLHPAGPDLGTREDSDRILAAHSAGLRGSVRIVNPGAPPMVLPGYRSVRIISDTWGSVAKAADVCLVLDISASMEGSKLTAACEAVRRFCARPQSTATAVGLVTFESTAVVAVPVQPIAVATPSIESAIRSASARGGTALFDAVATAVRELERAAGPGHLRALLLLTDGEENSSHTTRSDARTALDDAGVTVFAIAYGDDADEATLQLLAGASGLVVTASVRDVEQIYEALSAHV
jgi:Ca-activated chloride channel family protein